MKPTPLPIAFETVRMVPSLLVLAGILVLGALAVARFLIVRTRRKLADSDRSR